MAKTYGRVTLPSESDFLEETKELLDRWGADAIRDSDGTKLSDDIKALDAKIYTTYFVARGHNDFAEQHMDECQQIYLMSDYVTAISTTLEIKFLATYYEQQVQADKRDVKKYWDVIDRTTQETLSTEDWELVGSDTVVIKNTVPYHEYTVNFLAFILWDPTQMYNHITNDWGDKAHEIPFDVRKSASGNYMVEYLKTWLMENPDTDVVRFTTFFYHFTLIFNNYAKEKFVDWCGYGASISPEAMEEFEKRYGYCLKSEDMIQNGTYNSAFCVPTQAYLDYIDMTQEVVAEKAKELVDLTHAAGKEAMMFLGDNWIGTEPYGKHFPSIGLDAVVGSVGNGATLRLISDIPGVKYHEGRFLPYFFPDTFYEGNDPTIEAIDNWLCARRAMMRKPIDRIGYGGYPSLAYKFPKFVDYIERTCNEFRDIYDKIHDVKPYTGLTVAILNCWGALRSWHPFMVAHGLWCKQIYSYQGMLESLSGASVEVRFISFDDIKDGISKDIDVIINAGSAMTAFSGGAIWNDPKMVTMVREWIAKGGGFVGIGEPTAYQKGGHFFQLSQALGVDKECSFTLHTDKYFHDECKEHFITQDLAEPMNFGEGMRNVYATSADTQIISYHNGEVEMATHTYGKGRCVYMAGLPYSEQNTRVLMRSLYYAANKEETFTHWYADNLYCEVHAYPSIHKYAILNNTNLMQTTRVYDGTGKVREVTLDAGEIRWEEYHE